MKRFTTLSVILLWALTAHNQSFTPQTSGVTNILSSIDFANDNVGMAVSYGGEIVYTTNGGTNWIHQTSGTTTTLRDVVMVNTSIALAVGYNGLILRTANGGFNWSPVSSGVSVNLTCIFFNGSKLYVTGSNGVILKSSDLGITWSVYNLGTSFTPKTIYFTSDDVGYAAGETGVIFKTTDGGVSWTQLVSGIESPSLNFQLSGIYFTDANNGFVVGGNMSTNQGFVLRTANAGASWSVQQFTDNYLYTIEFLNSTTGFISGGSITANSSKILKTNDGGNTWQIQPTASSRQAGASFPSFNAGYTCGLDGTILKIKEINLGVEDLTANFKLEVFPNPNSGHFKLSLDEGKVDQNTVVEVLNLNGEVVYKEDYQVDMDISNLVNGVYFVRITNDKLSVTQKIIKE